MDFHSLPRRELQALCKKNSIPANMTNVAMADALQALQCSAEGLEFSSPTKAEPKSPPKTGRRTSTRLSARPALPQGSPMPRSRRVTAKAPGGVLRLDDGDEEEKTTVTTRRRGRVSLKKGSENANVKKMADLGNEEQEQDLDSCSETVEAPSNESAVDNLNFSSIAVSMEQVAKEVEEVVVEEINVEILRTPNNCQNGEVERSSGENADDLLPHMQTLSISVEAPEAVTIDSGETADDLLYESGNGNASKEPEEVLACEAVKESEEANNIDCDDDISIHMHVKGLDSGNDNLVIGNALKEPEVLAFEAMKESDEANNIDCDDDISIHMHVEGLDSGNDNLVNDNASKEPVEVVGFEAMKESDEANNVDCHDDVVNNDATKEPEEVIFPDSITLATTEESEEANNVVNRNEAITFLRTNNDDNNEENAGEEGQRLSMMGLGKADLGNMSLRKLRAMYKDVKMKEGEEKRSALKALDENCLSII